jgi:Mg/Co/Ni transporter MgtE
MNIQSVKIELLKLIIDTDNPSVLDKIMRIFQNEKQDFWSNLSKEDQEEILTGIDELDKGEKFTYDEIIKKHRK